MSRNASAPAPRQAPKAAKPGRRIAGLMLLFVVSVFGIQMGSAWYNDRYGPMGGYNLLGLNYRELPITSYWIDGVWGGNIFPGRPEGGGGSTCCLMLSREAKTVTATWEVEQTREDVYADKPIEIRTREVSLPDITDPKKGYLGVHFLPNDEIQITFKDFGADVLIPIKEIDYGFGTIEEEKQKGLDGLKKEFE